MLEWTLSERKNEPLYLLHTHSLGHVSEREEAVGARKKEATTVRRSSYCFGVLLLVLILSLRKLQGFLHLWFP